MFEEGFDYQATMLQPVGGMDRIPFAFAQKLGRIVKFGCPVKELRKTTNGVRVVYMERGSARALEGAYCICTLPLSVLKTVQHDLSPSVSAALSQVGYAAAYKIAWESRRFWEQENNIYGGISWIAEGPISIEASRLANIWYPSAGFLADKGVLVAGYGQDSASLGDSVPWKRSWRPRGRPWRNCIQGAVGNSPSRYSFRGPRSLTIWGRGYKRETTTKVPTKSFCNLTGVSTSRAITAVTLLSGRKALPSPRRERRK